MKTLYININGEDIQGNADIHVVGHSEDALINAFYYELGNEILNGVPGVSKISKRDLVLEFKTHNKDRFDKILDQWTALKKIVLGANPSGQFGVELPDEYVKWLQDKSDRVYRAIAMSLVNRGRKVNISIDNIYEAIELLIDSIEPDDCSDCEQFVVNEYECSSNSALSSSLIKNTGLKFIAYKDFKFNNDNAKLVSSIISSLINHSNNAKIIRYENAVLYQIAKDYVFESNRHLSLFSDGLILVKNPEVDKFGFINDEGKLVLDFIYPEATPFSCGYAWVFKNSLKGNKNKKGWYVIDTSGKIVNKVVEVIDIANIVSRGHYHIINTNGYYVELNDGRYFDIKGNYIGCCRLSHKNEYYYISNDGLFYYRNGHETYYKNEIQPQQEPKDIIIHKSNNALFGVINQITGKEYIPHEFSSIFSLGGYHFLVKQVDNTKFIGRITV